MATSRVKTALLLALGAAVLIALVAYVGPARVVGALAAASPLHLSLALASYLAFFVLRGIRWRMLFHQGAPDVRLSSTTGITAVGWLANSILPLKGGDVLRAALISKRDKVPLAMGASTVALERVLDLLGLAIVAALGLLLIPRTARMPEGIAFALEVAWVLPIAGILGLVFCVLARARVMRVVRATFGRLGRVGERVVEFADTLLAGLAALGKRPMLMAKLLPATILVAAANALVFAFLVLAFMPGTPFGLALGGAALFMLSFVVSVTPGNVGTYEAAFVAIYAGLGLATELVVPAAILTHLTTTLIVAVLGSLGILALGLESGKPAWRPARAPGGTP